MDRKTMYQFHGNHHNNNMMAVQNYSNSITTVNDNGNMNRNGNDQSSKQFPEGYRFDPTDYELIDYYLRRKFENKVSPTDIIKEVNIYQYHPQYLFGNNSLSLQDEYKSAREWSVYFFTPRDRKYANGKRPDRAASGGYWKASGSDESIKNKSKVIIGSKRLLVFHEGTPKNSKKTNWVMREFMLKAHHRTDHAIAPTPITNSSAPPNMKLDGWVLCKIYKAKDRHSVIVIPQSEFPNSIREAQSIQNPSRELPNSAAAEPQSLLLNIGQQPLVNIPGTGEPSQSNRDIFPVHGIFHQPFMNYNTNYGAIGHNNIGNQYYYSDHNDYNHNLSGGLPQNLVAESSSSNNRMLQSKNVEMLAVQGFPGTSKDTSEFQAPPLHNSDFSLDDFFS